MQAKRITVERIDALLPQTQCGKCSYPGCLPYAEAIAAGEAINRCPPGGQQTVDALAVLTGQPSLSLAQPAELPQLAVIDEDICIGCTKCIKACPVDAILGAPKQMHGVLTQECTGCELCVAPCPVDCISIVPHPDWQNSRADSSAEHAWLAHRAGLARQRHHARNERLARLEQEAAERRRSRRHQRMADSTNTTETSPSAATSAADEATRRRRLKIRLARMRRDDPARDTLEKELQALNGTMTSRQHADDTAQQARTQHMALAAAEERLRRAERHLAHCQRQEGPAEIAGAQEQLTRARQQFERAREGTS